MAKFRARAIVVSASYLYRLGFDGLPSVLIRQGDRTLEVSRAIRPVPNNPVGTDIQVKYDDRVRRRLPDHRHV